MREPAPLPPSCAPFLPPSGSPAIAPPPPPLVPSLSPPLPLVRSPPPFPPPPSSSSSRQVIKDRNAWWRERCDPLPRQHDVHAASVSFPLSPCTPPRLASPPHWVIGAPPRQRVQVTFTYLCALWLRCGGRGSKEEGRGEDIKGSIGGEEEWSRRKRRRRRL